MLYRTRDDEIPIPIERDTGWVHMAVTGDIGHGIGSASVVKAPKLDGAPEVTARVHTLHPVEPRNVGIRQLVQHPARDGRCVPRRDERAFAGAVRSHLVKPHDEPRRLCDAVRGG